MRAHCLGALVVVAGLALVPAAAHATEICGNGIDDDANGLADEGCMPSVTTGICESPLDCGRNGAVAPLTGALTYEMEADLSPGVPYGPSIAMRRSYTSAYAPSSGAPTYRKPMGERWQHGYMSWLDKTIGPFGGSEVVLHTTQGQDIKFWYSYTSGGHDYYTPQARNHFAHLRQSTSSPYEWELRTLEGEVFVYDFNGTTGVGKLIELHDTLATPNVVSIAYDGNGQIDTVTDASGARRLLFGYTGGLLTSIAYQTIASGTPTTRSTATYAYTSGELTSFTIGSSLVHTYSYTGGLLTKIEDSASNDLASFAYETGTGKVARIDTGDGAVGYEYNSGRASCSGKTVLYYNAPTAISCDDDSDCATVSTDLLCGGETDSSSSNTGKCYYAGRCLTVNTMDEHLVSTVAPVAPSGGTCDGACTDVAEYNWSGFALRGVKDPNNHWTTYDYNWNGLPTKIVTGDNDAFAANGGGLETWLFYGNSSFPGRVTEIRRASVAGGTCDAWTTSGCKRTLMTYDTDGLLMQTEEIGSTLDASGSWVSYSYVTTYDYDSVGRLIQIDGPLSGSNDVVDYVYWSSTDVLKNGFLQEYKRKKDSTNYLVYESHAYDHWGHATSVEHPDGTFTCSTYDADQGHLTEQRETMAGQTSCSSNSADIVTEWQRDTIGRVTTVERPDGSCEYRAYDSLGRLATIKRRDDCNPASSGDTITYTYGDGNRVTLVEVTDAGSTVTFRQELGYHESRRLKSIEDPESGQSTTYTYDDRGLPTQVDAPSGLGKVTRVFDAHRRETTRHDYTTSSDYDAWTLAYSFLFGHAPNTVTDEDGKVSDAEHDDMGRLVLRDGPDTGTTLYLYDATGRLASRIEAEDSSSPQTHTFTYDFLGRTLTEEYHSSCGVGAGPEVEYVYDAPPSSCPSGATCLLTAGRLAYARVSLACDSGASDKSYDQETFYGYDAAGRMTQEYIRDDGGRVAVQDSTWTKGGALATHTTPSGVVLGASFGSSGSNSDSDRINSLWRGTSSSPVIDNVSWFPFGGVASYRHQNTINGNQLETVISRDLAYRIDNIVVEDSVNGTDVFDIAITRDDKGRVTHRDFTGGAPGLQDSMFIYDDLDRILCEKTSGTGCPTAGSTLKNNISGSPPYTAAGVRRQFNRAIPGHTTTMHQISLVSGAHRIDYLDQPGAYGQTDFGYNAKGDRTWETNYGNDMRSYGYDDRRNLTSVNGKFKTSSTSSWYTYFLTSSFDHRSRRVSKTVYNAATAQTSLWYFYRDPLGRLVEIKYWPDTSSTSTYFIWQLTWLGSRSVGMFQTDYPGGTLSRRFVHGDETNRPVELYSWPSSGDGSRMWAIDPDAWGNDSIVVGTSVFQPLTYDGLYRDEETVAWYEHGQMQRPPLAHSNAGGSYDLLVGSSLQSGDGGAMAREFFGIDVLWWLELGFGFVGDVLVAWGNSCADLPEYLESPQSCPPGGGLGGAGDDCNPPVGRFYKKCICDYIGVQACLVCATAVYLERKEWCYDRYTGPLLRVCLMTELNEHAWTAFNCGLLPDGPAEARWK